MKPIIRFAKEISDIQGDEVGMIWADIDPDQEGIWRDTVLLVEGLADYDLPLPLDITIVGIEGEEVHMEVIVGEEIDLDSIPPDLSLSRGIHIGPTLKSVGARKAIEVVQSAANKLCESIRKYCVSWGIEAREKLEEAQQEIASCEAISKLFEKKD